MIAPVRGTYENGHITLDEDLPVTAGTRVVVTVIDETGKVQKPAIQFGRMKGTFWMSDTFNDPLDDMADYM